MLVLSKYRVPLVSQQNKILLQNTTQSLVHHPRSWWQVQCVQYITCLVRNCAERKYLCDRTIYRGAHSRWRTSHDDGAGPNHMSIENTCRRNNLANESGDRRGNLSTRNTRRRGTLLASVPLIVERNHTVGKRSFISTVSFLSLCLHAARLKSLKRTFT